MNNENGDIETFLLYDDIRILNINQMFLRNWSPLYKQFGECNKWWLLHVHTQIVYVLVQIFYFVHFPHKQCIFINKSDGGSDVLFEVRHAV